MKVTLINPNFHGFSTKEPPLGLAYLTAALRNLDCNVSIVDAHAENLNVERATDKIIKTSPDMVGVYSTTPQIKEAISIASGIKEYSEDIQTVFGGPHPTVLPDEVLSSGVVDIVVRGEGEHTLQDIIQKPLREVDGISWKDKGAGKVVHNKSRPLIENLDELPFPSWDGFPIESYKNPTKENHPYLPVMATRGCPYKCVFCFDGIFGKNYRTRSPENVVDEVEYLKDKYKIKEYVIIDDNFTLNEKYALSVCDEICSRNIDLPFSCAGGIRADAAAPRLIKRMKDAGCYYLSFGVESGSQLILDKIQKDIKLDQVRAAVKTAKSYKIKTTCFVLIGLPGDTPETIKKTIEFVKELDPDLAQIGGVVPYPSTPLYERFKKEGKLLIDEWDRYIRYTPTIFFETEASAEELEKAYKDAVMDFYLRPQFLLKKFVQSPGSFLRLGLFFFKYNKFSDFLFRS